MVQLNCICRLREHFSHLILITVCTVRLLRVHWALKVLQLVMIYTWYFQIKFQIGIFKYSDKTLIILNNAHKVTQKEEKSTKLPLIYYIKYMNE